MEESRLLSILERLIEVLEEQNKVLVKIEEDLEDIKKAVLTYVFEVR